jgi:hypothetical protein
MLEDGISMYTIYSNYKFTLDFDNFILLKKNKMTNRFYSLVESASFETNLRDPIYLIEGSTIFSKIFIQPTFFGKFLNLLFKNPQVSIKIFFDNGDYKVYRLIPGMAKSGFIISPFIQNTSDLKYFFTYQNEKLKKPKYFVIDTFAPGFFYERNIQVVYNKIN